MTERLHHFLQGLRQVLVLAPDADYHWPQRGDSAQDARNLRGDAARVARDLSATTERYGEQIQHRET